MDTDEPVTEDQPQPQAEPMPETEPAAQPEPKVIDGGEAMLARTKDL